MAIVLKMVKAIKDPEHDALDPTARATDADVPDLTNAELVHLRIRVIAIENLMTAQLAQGSDCLLQVAREVAEQITPRPSHTRHPLTIQAANHMTGIIHRAIEFRSKKGG